MAVNTVSEEKKIVVTAESQTAAPVSSVQITGITTGASAPPVPVLPIQDDASFRPQRVGSMFARFIDDIFQVSFVIKFNLNP